MKDISIEQLSEWLSSDREMEGKQDVIRLTKDANAVAWLLKLPRPTKDAEGDVMFFADEPSGLTFLVLQAKLLAKELSDSSPHVPTFGAGRGTLTIANEIRLIDF